MQVVTTSDPYVMAHDLDTGAEPTSGGTGAGNSNNWTSHMGATGTLTGWESSGILTIANGGWDNPYTGSLDEVRVYTRALSGTEVGQHNSGMFTNDTGLTLHLSMNDDITVDGATQLRAKHLDQDYGDALLSHKTHSLTMLQFLPALAQVIELGPDASNIDGQGIIDLLDFSMLADDYNAVGKSLWGDINGDDTVDMADTAEMVQYWLGQ